MAILPQVRVFTEFSASPIATINPLNAFYAGPLADLIRFNVESERSRGRLGYYDRDQSTVYAYPEKPVGSTVDQDYFKLFARDALLQYFTDTVSGGSAITTVANTTNQVTSDTLSFSANGLAYPHSSVFGDRGVLVGDVVKLRCVPAVGSPTTIWTYVKGFNFSQSIPAIGQVAFGGSNQAPAAAASATVTRTAGPVNCVALSVDETQYEGFETRGLTDTYTILVTESSSGGDLTTAKIRVISASGRDDVASATPGADGVEFIVGGRSLALTFDVDVLAPCQATAASAGVTDDDLVAGQQWEIEITDTYAEPTVMVSGTYTGTADTTYIVEVIRGVLLGDENDPVGDTNPPTLLSVTTTDGSDGGTTVVYNKDTSYALGTKGLLIETDESLYEGDRFIIPITAAAGGAKRTLVLGHSLPEGIASGTPCDLTLFIQKPSLEINQERIEASPTKNFTTDAFEITVESAMTAYDPSWTVAGVPQPLPVVSDAATGYGELFAEYRLWLSDACGKLLTISDSAQLADVPGPLDVDNPLKYALFIGTANNNGQDIYYTGICDESDLDEWSSALDLSLASGTIHDMVPLTHDYEVHQLFSGHVDTQSSPENGVFRAAWLALSTLSTVPVLHTGSSLTGYEQPTSVDGNTVLATVSDNPNQSGTQFTRLLVPASNSGFETLGVRPKDIVRINYGVDSLGNTTYKSFVVDQVVNQDELILATSLPAAEPTPIKIEIWRNLTATEEATAIAAVAGSYSSENVRVVWPDEAEVAGTIVPGYHIAAAYAATAGGVAPHQGLTNVPINGFTSVSRTTDKFSRVQLDLLSDAGVFIVTQDIRTGDIYARHALTTGSQLNLKEREEMIVRNLHSIARRFKLHYEPFIGVSNVTPETLSMLRVETLSLINVLRTELLQGRIGAQLIDAEIVSLRQHPTFLDRVEIVINLDGPVPFNNCDLTLVI